MIKELVKERIENTFSKLEKDNSLLSIVYSNLDKFKQEKKLHSKYLNQWEKVLKLPLNDIKNLMLEDSDRGEILRSTSIFIRI